MSKSGKAPPPGPLSIAMERGGWNKPLPLSIAMGRGPGGGAVFLLLVLALLLTGCQQADRIIAVAPHLVGRGLSTDARIQSGQGDDANAQAAQVADLPPEQPTEGFDFEPLPDQQGQRRFQIRLRAGGSPSMVAAQKLTPLFEVEGKGAAQYVSDAYFQANPGRTPQSMQPGDAFVLSVPAETFIVRWQQEQTVDLQGPTRVHDYVGERGDRLRVYQDQRIPIEHAYEPADGSGRATLRLSGDLAYLLGAGRLNPIGLARVVYQVPDPDLYQVMAMRQLAEQVKPGQSTEIVVDRTRKYLDPVREALAQAVAVEPVPDEGRDHLKRATFTAEQGLPYFAIEDALSERTDILDLPRGEVFRIEYGRDGVVRVAYLTGDDDRRGRRDPYKLREAARWADLYERFLPGANSPVAWGAGEPSDLEPFPTARDPNRRVQDGERSYDYLVPGRAIVLTFRPTRSKADVLAGAEFRDSLRSLRDEYHDDLAQVISLLEGLRR